MANKTYVFTDLVLTKHERSIKAKSFKAACEAYAEYPRVADPSEVEFMRIKVCSIATNGREIKRDNWPETLRSEQLVQLVMENDGGGSFDPVFIGFSEALAWEAYNRTVADNANEVPPEEVVNYDADDIVEVNGKQYELTDQYGEPAARIFDMPLDVKLPE